MNRLPTPARWLALLLWLVCARAMALDFGVFPNLPPRQLIALYTPLADSLSEALGEPVRVLTAPDFATFVSRTAHGDYDLLLTAPHLAWLAQRDAGYQPLAQSREPLRGLLIVRADSPLHTLRDLAGRTVLTPDPLAIVALAMETRLEQTGFPLARHPRLAAGGSHTNAALRVANGQADAAIVGSLPFSLLPGPVRSQLRVLAQTPPMQGQMLLLHPGLRPKQRERIEKEVRRFAASPAGQALFRSNGFGGLEPLDSDGLAGLRPYAEEAARRMERIR